MIANTGSPVTAALYEKKIEELVYKKELLTQKASNLAETQPPFDEVFEHSMNFLGSPYKIWKNSDFAWKRAVLRLAFSEPIKYTKKEGYRTPKTTFPFKALSLISIEKDVMVHRGGAT